MELAVTFDALIEGRARLDYRPEQVEGTLRLRASVGLTAPAVELGLSAAAELTARGPRPLVIDATVGVAADLPWPLPDYETELHLHWDEPIAPPVDEPLVAISVGNDRTGPDATVSVHSVRLADGADPPRSALTPGAGRVAAEAAPVVPLDAKGAADLRCAGRRRDWRLLPRHRRGPHLARRRQVPADDDGARRDCVRARRGRRLDTDRRRSGAPMGRVELAAGLPQHRRRVGGRAAARRVAGRRGARATRRRERVGYGCGAATRSRGVGRIGGCPGRARS